MRRWDLDRLSPAELPDGYTIRSFADGDESGWESIIADAFGREVKEGYFDERMRSDHAFRPERIFFVTFGDELVATASAWHRPQWGRDVGYLHMVGCRPSHSGKRLGLSVSLAALRHMAKDGRRSALLQTDDFRLPAIRTYLRMGFEPLLVHENQRERWRLVFKAMERPDLIERFRAAVEGPVAMPPTEQRGSSNA